MEQDIILRNDPEGMRCKLQQLNAQLTDINGKRATPPLCLLHFSDIHGDAKRLSNVLSFADHYGDYIRDVLHTGDSVRFSADDGLNFWNQVPGSEKILNTIGNHDTRVGSTWIGLSMEESFHTYFAPYITHWNAVFEQGKTYYYKDYPENRVRLIVLDCMHQTEQQLHWFEASLRDAAALGYHVLAAVHARAHWKFSSYSDSVWDDKAAVSWYAAGYEDTSSGGQPENLSDDYASAVDEFMQYGGLFIAWIHGHTHFKMLAALATHPNQLEIAVSNAGSQEYAWSFSAARVENTRSEDDFNLLSVDTDLRVLKLVKVGVDYDRLARHVDSCCYHYGSHRLLYG